MASVLGFLEQSLVDEKNLGTAGVFRGHGVLHTPEWKHSDCLRRITLFVLIRSIIDFTVLFFPRFTCSDTAVRPEGTTQMPLRSLGIATTRDRIEG